MEFFPRYRAISIVMVGIAFFLQGCVSKESLKKPVQKAIEKPLQKAVEKPIEKAIKVIPPVPLEKDDFLVAESFLRSGSLDKALESYAAYVEKHPDGEHVVPALHRMAEIYSKQGENGKALECYEQLARQHPQDPRLPEVRYQILSLQYQLGRYQDSRQQALEWVEVYAANPLKGRVLHILGLDCAALGLRDQAFSWWLQAHKEIRDDPQLESELRDELDHLIDAGDIGTLEDFSRSAAGTDFAPQLYYRLATLYMEQEDLPNARKAAMALVRSTPEQKWVTLGKGLLDRVEAELSVKKGTFGCLLPLSGPYAVYGQEVLNGIELGLGLFDAPHGGTEKITLLIRDTEGSPEITSSAVEALANGEHVVGIIGPLSSKVAVAAAGEAESMGVPIITLTQKEGITDEGEMVFRNFLVPSEEIKTLVNTSVRELGLKRFAILYPDNPYGRFFMNRFWDGLKEAGGSVTAVESYKPDQTDFRDQIRKMTGLYYPRPRSVTEKLREMRTPFEQETELEPAKPQPIIDFDAVFIPDDYQKIAMIAPQLMYHDVTDVRLIGTSLWQSPKLIEMAGRYVQGAIFTSGFFGKDEDPAVRTFVKDYEKAFESEPGILAATGYDTIRFLRAAVKNGDVRTRKDLCKAILALQDYHGVTGDMSFDSRGEVQKVPLVLTIKGRKMMVLP